jgi:hypothetical protein
MTRLSKYRRATVEVLRLGAQVPLITLQRRASLEPLAIARSACANRPSWPAIFVKAYAQLAQQTPVLRRAYFRYPTPHIREYPFSDAAIAVERSADGESFVYPLIVHNPEGYGIAAIDEMLRHAKTADLGSMEEFRRAERIGHLPWPLPRLAYWTAYNIASYRRHFFGTFGLTTVAAQGGELFNLVSPLATVLTYGPFSSDWTIDLRVMFDHRIVDAAPIARALARLEELLNGVITDEVELLAAQQARAAREESGSNGDGSLPRRGISQAGDQERSATT